MKKKTKLLQRSEKIYDFLNSTQGDSENPFGEFIEKQTKPFEWIDESNGPEEDADSVINAWKLAFALGYAIGNDVDLVDADILKDVVAIKEMIRKNQLLPYLSREKKAA